MRIVFVRHGEPNYELDCLTENGKIHAAKAAERLKEEGIEEMKMACHNGINYGYLQWNLELKFFGKVYDNHVFGKDHWNIPRWNKMVFVYCSKCCSIWDCLNNNCLF